MTPLPGSVLVLGLVPMHARPGDPIPPLTPERLLTAWTFDIWALLGVLVPTALYLTGVWRLHRRGDHWPVGRTLAFVGGGMGFTAIALLSPIATYDTVLLSVHMVQHMILTMPVPLFMALGAPVTLALRVLPKGTRRVLVGILHSKPVKVLSFPLVAFALYIANPFVLYFSPLYLVTLQSDFWHNFLHLHFVVTASLFYWPLVGSDPIPNRLGYPFRVLLFMLTLPFHAFLGVTIMGSRTLIAEEWYLAFERAWPPSPLADQEIAGGILWGTGDAIASLVIFILFVQWFRTSQAEARRVDRQLDREEAAARRRDRTKAVSSGAGEAGDPDEPAGVDQSSSAGPGRSES
ncbi:cytochrome c oxidase assembly protein [Microlunatus sp. Y2014]|uniref:cytochrome c oxidase assembly protein n=1 Tax=Microlunatus sp. Y2014 TaxID=3418488 RepID=UPI003DA74657